MFEGIAHKVIALDDAVGFDIQAYRLAAARIDNDEVCCLNTFSVLRAENWLRKLHDTLSRPGIGIVGATGSFESIQSLIQVVSRLQFVLAKPAAYDAGLARAFAWLVPTFHPPTAQAVTSTAARMRRLIGDLLRWRPRVEVLIPEH